MGTTGTGKMKISIDVSKRIRGEGVNADKMQIYVGLHITTNKVRQMINVVFLTTSLGVIQAINDDFSLPFFDLLQPQLQSLL